MEALLDYPSMELTDAQWQRFWGKYTIGTNDECWPWTAGTGSEGYGQFSLNYKTVLAHRLSYELCCGPILEGMTIDHTCHNKDLSCPGGKCEHRKCINPAHLQQVTRGVNNERGRGDQNLNGGTKSQLRKTHCPKGHRLSGKNVYKRKDRPGRECRACRAQAQAKHRGLNLGN